MLPFRVVLHKHLLQQSKCWGYSVLYILQKPLGYYGFFLKKKTPVKTKAITLLLSCHLGAVEIWWLFAVARRAYGPVAFLPLLRCHHKTRCGQPLLVLPFHGITSHLIREKRRERGVQHGAGFSGPNGAGAFAPEIPSICFSSVSASDRKCLPTCMP